MELERSRHGLVDALDRGRVYGRRTLAEHCRRMDVAFPAVGFELAGERVELRQAGHGDTLPRRQCEDGRALPQRVGVRLGTGDHRNTTLPGRQLNDRRSRRSM